MHRTLKAATCRPPAADAKAQLRRFNQFRRAYNEDRPHEALEQQQPAERYQSSPRCYRERPEPLRYPRWFELARVSSNGVTFFQRQRLYVGYRLSGKQIRLEAINDGVWEVYFGPVKLGRFDERQPDKGEDYFSLKV